ncbi:MAG: hypothetical protein KJ556_09450 [Gammaproteobacteria bacterium]|nr:hypothetical protein [Gammaproteobacteria bacterium]MBU2059281.1 hypothetical protein [Gammaproteobacteria bacterium]MBU2175339.1 hypothetical protein [Gammaproteobacteria bacterium]MBU2247547.1 hypothetical protein [Gammaproteobacteria bacterium]MBU2343293.1 hypothetical protein [Gammaproteobacteria bacterium]
MIKMDVLTQVLNRGISSSELRSTFASTDATGTSDKKMGIKAEVGIHVDISPLGLQKSKNTGRDKDIDESELPDDVKNSLKAIRNQQEELEEKREELQKLMNNNSMPAEEKEQKVKQLQAEIGNLVRAVADAKSQLLSSMQEQGLSDQQIQKAMMLMD